MAEGAAQTVFLEIAADFMAKYQQQIEQERHELDEWLIQRVDEIVGRSEQALPLFRGLTEKNQLPLERLTEFVAQTNKASRERSQAASIVKLYSNRDNLIKARLTPVLSSSSLLGMTMLFTL